jgi:hypothetical protein
MNADAKHGRHLCAAGERVCVGVSAEDNLVHVLHQKGWVSEATVAASESFFHTPRRIRLFECWIVTAFTVWTIAWYRQSVLLFAVDFAIGFIPPSILIVLTGNVTMLKMVHKEFVLWYTTGNMVIFSACMPYICSSDTSVVALQIVGQVYCAWMYCAIDSVKLSRRLKLIFAAWILGYWASFYYYLSWNQSPWPAGPTTKTYVLPAWWGAEGVELKTDLNLLAKSSLLNSMLFIAQQAWKILRRAESATMMNLVPTVWWDPLEDAAAAKEQHAGGGGRGIAPTFLLDDGARPYTAAAAVDPLLAGAEEEWHGQGHGHGDPFTHPRQQSFSRVPREDLQGGERLLLRPGELVAVELEPRDNLAHSRLPSTAAFQLESVFNRPIKAALFEAWCALAFVTWGVAWHLQDEWLFSAMFAVGFVPPSLLIVLTANRSLLQLVHTEFTLWYTVGNMALFSAAMPYLCSADADVTNMQIVGQLFCAWLFCSLDCVQLSARFEVGFGCGLVAAFGWLYYCVAGEVEPFHDLARANMTVNNPMTGEVHELELSQLCQTFLLNTVVFTAEQVWKLMRHSDNATVVKIVPSVVWFSHGRRGGTASEAWGGGSGGGGGGDAGGTGKGGRVAFKSASSEGSFGSGRVSWGGGGTRPLQCEADGNGFAESLLHSHAVRENIREGSQRAPAPAGGRGGGGGTLGSGSAAGGRHKAKQPSLGTESRADFWASVGVDRHGN